MVLRVVFTLATMSLNAVHHHQKCHGHIRDTTLRAQVSLVGRLICTSIVASMTPIGALDWTLRLM